MTNSTRRRTATAAAVAAVAVSLSMLLPAAAPAAPKFETLRYFMKEVAMTITTPDGTVHRKPPYPEPRAGNVLDLYTVGWRGDHRRHAKRATASEHVSCTFETAPASCISHVAIGSSMLIFTGSPPRMIAGTGRYLGATGRLLKNKDVAGGTDVVARIRLRERRGAGASFGGAAPADGSADSSTGDAGPDPAWEPAWERALRLRGEAMNRLLR